MNTPPELPPPLGGDEPTLPPKPLPAEVPPAPAPQPELPPPITVPPPEVPPPFVSRAAHAWGRLRTAATPRSPVGRSVAQGLLAGAVLSALVMPLWGWYSGVQSSAPKPAAVVVQAPRPALVQPMVPASADFGTQRPSLAARQLADWVARAGDNAGAPFLVVDKRHARLYVFDAQARLVGASTVLVGTTLGDDTVPGVGDKPIAQVTLQERTTPAGRFMGQRGRNATGEDVVWVDYSAAVSMHRVRATNASERRHQRLASGSLADKRITYGCINVPAEFYDAHVNPVFLRQRAPVYVLPDTKTLAQVFPRLAHAS